MSETGRKLLQINATANWGSTGKIAEQINQLARQNGWETYFAYGRNANESQSKLIQVGSRCSVLEHFAEHRFLDNDGLASRNATKQLIKRIKEIAPDIIHLHNIHDHWLNYKILFEYLNTLNIPIVWTQHDCWSFTGGCWYYSNRGCNQWMDKCESNCPARKNNRFRRLINHTQKHYQLKKELFTATANLTLVPVSRWLESELKKSFLKDKTIYTICNGIDTNIFHPVRETRSTLQKYGLEEGRYLIGVASIWSDRKGFADYLKLASLIPADIKIVLVGLDERQREEATKVGIVGVARTENVNDLVALYTGAAIVMNLSYEETFGLTTVEGFACGTPGIVYNATASPELITPETGVVVEPGYIEGISMAVQSLMKKEKPIKECRERAVNYYNNIDRFNDYISLYDRLILENNQ